MIKLVTIEAAKIILVLLFCCIVCAIVTQWANGADCRAFFYKKQVVQQVAYAAPVYYAQPYYAPLAYYAAGADIQSEAQAEKIARLAVPKILAQLQAPLKQQQVNGHKIPYPNSARPLPPQPELPTTGSVLARKCAECHSGARPKKGIVIDGTTPMFCDQITMSIRMIRDDKMPKGGPPLTPDEKGQALEELLLLERQLENPIPQPEPEPITPQPQAIRPSQNPRESGDLQ